MPHNVKNEESFQYLLEIVKERIFGIEVYPSIFIKAAYYMYSINADHIFHDGNKRTGLGAALVFIDKNGYFLKPEISENEMIEFAWSVARREKSIEEIATWFSQRIEKKF